MAGKFIYKVKEKYSPTNYEIEILLNDMGDANWEYVNTIIENQSGIVKFVFRKFIPNKKIDTETI